MPCTKTGSLRKGTREPVLGMAITDDRSECQAQLPLKTPVLITLVGNCPEARIVDAVLHRVEIRVIENVRRIEPNLDLLALRKSEVFAHCGVERPGTRTCNG